MTNDIFVGLLGLALFGAGVFNAIGTADTRADYVRWGYPAWWCRVTGGLEIASAALTVVPATRVGGLILAALIVAAAILTVLRSRDFKHLAPLGVFVVLLVGAAVST